MPLNRNALIRYRTIDSCLRNRYRKWTLDNLIDACSEALYEYEGIDRPVSKRTIQHDIQLMRSNKLGYNAPIIVQGKKYYTYSDSKYAITNIPLTEQDLSKLTEVTQILKQFKGFTHFYELSGMVQRLEDKVYTAKTKKASIIDLEKNDHLKGLEYLDQLYQIILKQKTIEINYKSFKAKKSSAFIFYSYFLKEYRNRWFVLGKRNKTAPLQLLALDRIQKIKETDHTFIENNEVDLQRYFDTVIGVSVSENVTVEKVVFVVDHQNAPYVITKPIHKSQEMIKQQKDGILFSIQVQLNFELERELLGFGASLKVIAPEKLKDRIAYLLDKAASKYKGK